MLLDMARANLQLPPVPSLVPIYKSTQLTNTNETTTTFAGVDIGTPHPKRLVILASFHGIAAAASGTIAGYNCHVDQQNTAHEVSIMSALVPHGTTATITVSATGSVRKAVSVYVAYPEVRERVSGGSDSAATTVDAVVTLKAVKGGFVVYAGAQAAVLGAFTTLWSGADAVTENVDAQQEAVSSYTMGLVPITISSDTTTLTLQETVSGTKRLAAVAFRPPYI
jgi:hypothetical protein